ncbi:hypothetical protein [Hansschlegelia plantiphila]|uniref:hypothetical protein n=1 Tax=Hansschlegelia plantiphila TaxID=374655 RepID=UPI0022F28FFE|nr:hypothetical protein [Hansschlegelia plantiphila]
MSAIASSTSGAIPGDRRRHRAERARHLDQQAAHPDDTAERLATAGGLHRLRQAAQRAR